MSGWDDMFAGNRSSSEKTEIRQDEVSGKQYLFHSLPKEFLGWLNNKYILEKMVKADPSLEPESLLNAYMWKAIGDGTKFAFLLLIGIYGFAIKLLLTPNWWGLTLGLLFFFPLLAYVTYHFLFYAKMRAMEVGEVTRKGIENTVYVFYTTFGGVVFSMVIAFFFIYSILEDIALWLHHLIISFDTYDDSMWSWIKHSLIVVYNSIIDILSPPPDDLFKAALFNPYFSVAIITFFSAVTIFLFERDAYNERRARVIKEIEEHKFKIASPMEQARKKLEDF